MEVAKQQGLSPVVAWRRQPSLIDYADHVAGVCFTSGCNFRCGFCHNAPLLGVVRDGVSWADFGVVCGRWQADWADGVVVTGGEPTLSAALPELLRFLRARGLAVKLDTNGSRPDVLAAVLPLVDAVAMDIKCAPADYPALTGFAHPERIAESAALLRAWDGDGEFRTTVLEGWHGDAQADAMGELLRGAARLVLQPFLPREDLPDPAFRALPRTPPAVLARLRERLAPYVGEVILRDA